MAQVVRWYICPLQTRADGRIVIPQSLRTLLQGRWTYYILPGNQWALTRIRGDDAQHAILDAAPGMFAIPRERTGRWSVRAPQALKDRLTALGLVIQGDPWPDEVLDLIGQFHQNFNGNYKSAWSRAREKRSDEDSLGAVEQV